MVAAVSVETLTKRFGRVLALDRVSFEVPRNCLFGLLGPNGAGKTTLLGIAAGFLRPTSGTIEVLGVDVSQIGRLRGRFSMLPQDAAFQAGVPVIDQLVMFARLNGYGPADAIRQAHKALDLVGLGEIASRRARALSHGMMKRVMLCQAFIGEPEVLFLDEPTSGLDPENARRVRDLIRQYRQTRTILLSSHDLREVQEICDHVAILHEGRLRVAQSMDALTARAVQLRIGLGAPLTAEAEAALRALPDLSSCKRVDDNAISVELNLASGRTRNEVIKDITRILVVEHDLPLRSLTEGESLETRFLEITSGRVDPPGATRFSP